MPSVKDQSPQTPNEYCQMGNKALYHQNDSDFTECGQDADILCKCGARITVNRQGEPLNPRLCKYYVA